MGKEKLSKKKFHELFKYVPRLAADGIVVANSRILLAKRKYAPYRGMWCIPGGFVEKDETVESAAVREVYEETGIKSKAARLVGVYSSPRRDPRGHVVAVVFILRPRSKKIRISDETEDVRFFEFNKIPKKLAADHSKILKDAVKLVKKKAL